MNPNRSKSKKQQQEKKPIPIKKLFEMTLKDKKFFGPMEQNEWMKMFCTEICLGKNFVGSSPLDLPTSMDICAIAFLKNINLPKQSEAYWHAKFIQDVLNCKKSERKD